MLAESSLLESIRSAMPSGEVAPPERLADYAVDGMTPGIAVCPGTAEEVAAVLAIAARHGAAVIPWGGGTSMAIGGLPRHYDIALDTRRLDQVVEHAPADLTVVVQAGARLQQLQDCLARSGQYLPLDPPSPQSATIGGILASNADGPWRYAYGWPRDWVLGMKVALADGRVIKAGGHVVKNVAGYDMTRLYAGSFGTLGVIVEAAFRVTPLPQARRTGLAFFDSCSVAIDVALRLHQRNLSLESLDVLGTNADGLLAGIGRSAASWALLVGAAGNSSAVERSLLEAEEVCRGDGVVLQVPDEQESRRLWDEVRARCQPNGEDDALLTRASLLPAQVAAFTSELPAMARGHGLSAAANCRPGLGSVYTAWRGDRRSIPDSGLALAADLREVVWGLRGSLVVESCPPALKRQIAVWGEPRSDFPLVRRLKEQLDPQGTLSAGRFVGGL
ncbi:MAG: FAD-binding oxidoreductase [Dehalococcoidia bacterium]|jgi:glycolate oxidase FAD binding subunit